MTRIVLGALASALLSAGCYRWHGPGDVGAADAGGVEPDAGGVCFGEAEVTLSIRPGAECDVATVAGTGVVTAIGPPAGTTIRLRREDLGWEDAHLEARVLECASDGEIRLWQVSSLLSDCDGAMSWAPECPGADPWERNWRWFGDDLEEAELYLQGEGALIELSLCEGGV